MKTRFRPRQSGSTLVVVMIIMATLAVIVAVAADYTANIGRQVQRSNTLESAVAVGDSSMEILFANWRILCRANPSNVLPSLSFALIPQPTAAMFPSLTTLPGFSFGSSTIDYYGTGTPNPPTISNFKVVAATPEWSPYPAASAATPKPIVGPAASDVTTLTDTTPATFNYIASADITLPTLKGNVVAKVRRVFQKQQQSPWNFAIFYEDPLEIHPGPQFTVTGWVHTNSDLYTAHDTLTFADKVTFGGDWNIDFMPGDEQHNGNTPTKPNYPSTLPPARDGSLQAFGIDPSLIDSTDTNPNNDSYHELIEPPVTGGGNTDPLASSRYYDAANIIITVDSLNTVTIGIGNGSGGFTSINPPTSGPDLRTLTQKNLYNMFNGAITTGGTIQDNREGAAVRVVKMDISKLISPKSGAVNGVRWGTTGYDATGSFGVNPIVYIYDNSATSSARRGIEFINGETLPGTGITIASQNPVYLKGDFNTGRGYDANGDGAPDNGVETPSNVAGSYSDPANPPNPQVAGYTRAPSSVVADAVNILSNSWQDSLSGTTPNASPTTVNTAVVSGIVPTADVGGDGAYSGGAENFPRFLENWSSDTLSYYGSMVELYKSQQSTGEWGKANVYSPPVRKWFFDSNFKTKPPPGSIMIYSYIKGRWSLL